MHKLHKFGFSSLSDSQLSTSWLLTHLTFLLFSPVFPGRVQGLPSVSALKFNGSLNIAVGTSTGQVNKNWLLLWMVFFLPLHICYCVLNQLYFTGILGWYVSTWLFVLISIVYFPFSVKFQLLMRNMKFQFFSWSEISLKCLHFDLCSWRCCCMTCAPASHSWWKTTFTICQLSHSISTII